MPSDGSRRCPRTMPAPVPSPPAWRWSPRDSGRAASTPSRTAPREVLSDTLGMAETAGTFAPGVPKLKPRWDLHLIGDDDQLGCAGESLSSVLGE